MLAYSIRRSGSSPGFRYAPSKTCSRARNLRCRQKTPRRWGDLGDLKRELIHKEGASGKWDAALVKAASGPRRKKAGARRTNA